MLSIHALNLQIVFGAQLLAIKIRLVLRPCVHKLFDFLFMNGMQVKVHLIIFINDPARIFLSHTSHQANKYSTQNFDTSS